MSTASILGTPAIKTQQNNFAEGDTLECILSKSPGYKVGERYTVDKDSKGILGLWGRDGYFDPLTLLLSTFKKV